MLIYIANPPVAAGPQLPLPRSGADFAQPFRQSLDTLGMTFIPDADSATAPGPAEVYAALWIGALLVAAGELADPLPPAIEELAREYFVRYAPEVKA